MQISDFTELMDHFVRSKGWYEPGSPRQQTPRNIAISLSLEANEVLEHFQWKETIDHPEELAGELADVALYLLQLAKISGIDLEQAIVNKLAANQDRSWDEPLNRLPTAGS